MDVQMGYDQLRLTPGAWLDLLGPLDRRRLERRPSGGSGHVLRMFIPRGTAAETLGDFVGTRM